MLLVLDNLAGHRTPSFVGWLLDHGIMPLYTPLGGSWLNMTESVQRILIRRGLAGTHPESVAAGPPAWRKCPAGRPPRDLSSACAAVAQVLRLGAPT